ncbi:MAG: hypothetical protein F4155_01550 [Acidimicrobiales bacterium]|nr:hypothetical protein [Acidimicrobiales bacterium]MYH73467.1 hypothetical protein [Acidimicrobiales bacterium]MYK72718.1 hypothetical protein [Acidimicrobiales bacterium]
MKTAWVRTTLGEIAEIVSGATPKTSVGEYWGGGIPWVTPKELSGLEGSSIASTERTLTDTGLRSCAASLLPRQSVLLSSRAPIGLVAINDVPMATNQGFKSLVPDDDRVDAKFLYWWLRSHRARLEAMGNGATFKEVSKKVVHGVEIDLPALAEQRQIAAVLDAAEALRQKRRSALAKLDDLKQAIFHDMFGAFGDSPQRVPLGEFMAAKKKSIDPRKFPEETFELFSIPAFDSGAPEIVSGRDVGSSKQLLELEDVVLSRIVPHIRRAWVVESDSGRRTIGSSEWIIFRSNRFVPAYLRQVLVSDRFHRAFMQTVAGVGGSLLRARPSHVAEIEVPFPPLEGQRRFEEKLSAVEAMRDRLRRSLDSLAILFASLQQRAFRGEL